MEQDLEQLANDPMVKDQQHNAASYLADFADTMCDVIGIGVDAVASSGESVVDLGGELLGGLAEGAGHILGGLAEGIGHILGGL